MNSRVNISEAEKSLFTEVKLPNNSDTLQTTTQENGTQQNGAQLAKSQNTRQTSLWEMRTGERPYALLNDKQNLEKNRYGQKIDLIQLAEEQLPKENSLYINQNPEVGTNPNRNKQHGFFFTADNCIGCHACEAACSEKNDNPAHLAFRSVGYVEGGSFPDYKRMNISMACNHCDDPVCLKGCPTRAYTKHAEYGAVLQDPETCFGCGYCTWVCPYNAPQLDPVQGQVSKCNMCVDRLEAELKPACVSACLGNALDFGVIENIPENREQAKTSIPGFPDSSITHPNIRFQQTRSLPEEMKRTDSSPVKYHKNEQGSYQPTVDKKQGEARHWNFKRLSSRENPLVLFTLLSQTALGAFAIPFMGSLAGSKSLAAFYHSSMYIPLLSLTGLMIGFGLFMSTMHLGKPKRFYRGFNNLRYSPVSREGLGIACFMGFLGLHIALLLPANSIFASAWQAIFASPVGSLFDLQLTGQLATVAGLLAFVSGGIGLYYMCKCYRIAARPFWNHWQVATSFFGSALSLGGLIAGTVITTSLLVMGIDHLTALTFCGAAIVAGLSIEAIGLYFHAKAMSTSEHEGAASHYVQTTTFGKTYLLRNALLTGNIVIATSMLVIAPQGAWGLGVWVAVGLIQLSTSCMGRALFYVLVIPTTMPGAFFWKNKGFEQHARDIGLANSTQAGIAVHAH